MTETLGLPKDAANAVLQWKGKHGIALAHHIKDLGIPPYKGQNDVFGSGYIDIANMAAEEHIDMLSRIGNEQIVLIHDKSLPELKVRYRTSVRGNSEGISTLEFRLNDQPVFHARFMCFEHEGKSTMAVVALQRFTDEKMSTVAKPFYKRSDLKKASEGEQVKSVPSLKEANPDRYQEYQRETEQVKKIEEKLKTGLSEIALASCMALSKARNDKRFLLTTYDNQYWVKIHDYDLEPVHNL